MDRTKTQFRRLQALDEVIRNGKYPNCLSFSMDWEVSQKTIQRDIEFMKYSLGAPVEYDRGKQGYYYTDTNWFLPALNVSEGELLALTLGVQAAAVYQDTPIAETLDQILKKIADSLPDIVSVVPADIADEVSFVGLSSRPIDPVVWRGFIRAIRNCIAVDVTYRAEAKPVAKSYRLHPCHLAWIKGDWYVFGRIPLHEDITQFALSRFENVSLTEELFAPLDVDQVKNRVQKSFGRFVPTGREQVYKIRVAFDAAVTHRIQARQWHPDQTIKLKKDGSGTLEFPAASLEEVTSWVLGWGRHVRVLTPKQAKDAVREEVRRMYEAL